MYVLLFTLKKSVLEAQRSVAQLRLRQDWGAPEISRALPGEVQEGRQGQALRAHKGPG